MFTLSSSHEGLVPLLPYALTSSETSAPSSSSFQQRPSLSALAKSVFVIVLNWERPESFLDDLRTWILTIQDLLRSAVHHQDVAVRRRQEALLDEMKRDNEHHVRTYTPPGSTSSSLGADTSIASSSKVNGASAEGTGPAIVPVSAPLSLSQNQGQILPLDRYRPV